MLAEGIETIEATEEAANDWVKKIRERWEATLLPQGKISPLFPCDLSFADVSPQLVDWCQYPGQESATSKLGGRFALIPTNA